MDTGVKPKVFVGSASEAKEVVKAFCKVLADAATMVPWWFADEFQVTHSVLDGLMDACDQYDFGLFILTPADTIESRGIKGKSARDNVLFEFGLFLGKLGPNRTFAVIEDVPDKKEKVKMPSDLAGIVIPHFETGDSHLLIASANNAADGIRKVIEREGRRHKKIENLFKSWGYDGANKTFSMTLFGSALVKNKEKLRDKSLVLVIRKHDIDVGFEEDRNIAVGNPRKLSRFSQDDLTLRTSGKGVLKNVKEGDQIEGYLLLAPAAFKFEKTKTIGEMLVRGCEFLEGRGARARLNKKK